MLSGDRHVHFGEESDSFASKGDNCIIVTKVSEAELQVHLGFLKYNNFYEISIPLDIPEHFPRDFQWDLDVRTAGKIPVASAAD